MILTEITKWLCNVKTNSHFVPCRSCSNSVKSHLKSTFMMRRGFHDLIAQQFFRIFSADCYFSDYKNKMTSRRFQIHLRKATFCSGISFHLFVFTYSQGYHRSRTKHKDGWGKFAFSLSPKKKTIVSICTTNIRSYVCLIISRNHLLQHCLILDFLLVIATKNVFFACLFVESIK